MKQYYLFLNHIAFRKRSKTIRNEYSSRFGKYFIHYQQTHNGVIEGAKIDSILTGKVRIVVRRTMRELSHFPTVFGRNEQREKTRTGTKERLKVYYWTQEVYKHARSRETTQQSLPLNLRKVI